jgi:glucokinase
MASSRVIGVDMGGSKLLAGVVDRDLDVQGTLQRRLIGLDQPSLIDLAVEAVDEARRQADGTVEAAGFGIPCLIDTRTGRARMAVNLPLAEIDFAAVMRDRLQMPVFVDNDANAAVLAEKLGGAARGCSEVVMLTIGTGIGGGVIAGGELYRGATGVGAELGHMVIDLNGPPCQGSCPNRGCIEAIASGTALAHEARQAAAEQPDSALGRAQADGQELAGPLVTELARSGDAAARSVLELVGTRLGVAVANLVNIFNPQVVVLGGGVMGAGDLLLEPVRAVVAARALPPSREEVRILPAAFGSDAGMVGAAALALVGLEKDGGSRWPAG